MKRTWLSIFLVLTLFGGVPLASAFEHAGLKVNGFLSQGYLKSANNNFLAETTDGSFEVSEFGLTLNQQLSDQLRLGVQLLARDLGTDGDHDVRLDWGMADYRFHDALGVRIGKNKIAVGLYNQERDSDFLRPMALLPQSVYDENKRNQLVGAAGLACYGHLPGGSWGDFDYQAFAGETSFADDSGQVRRVKSYVNNLIQSPGELTRFDADNRYTVGAALIYNLPFDGLRLGASWFDGKTEFDFTTRHTTFATDSDGTVKINADGTVDLVTVSSKHTGTARNRHFHVLSLEYALPRLTLAAEYTEFTSYKNFLGTVSDERSQGYYGLLSFRVTEALTCSLLYDVFYFDKDDKHGDFFVNQPNPQPDYYAWRKDFGVGVRYDFSYRWLVKVEWHRVDGAALGLPVYNPPNQTERHWAYILAKASFNF